MNVISRMFDDLLELFYPCSCITCGRRLVSQEKYMCINCMSDLPVTNFHLYPDNIVAQLFWGRVKIENATSFFYFRKGSRYQKLIYFMKYRGMKEIGLESGIQMGNSLLSSRDFCMVDIITPVPLHIRKKKKRGYNQSEWIALGIGNILHKPVSADNLYRKIFSSTQTQKNRFERWRNVDGIFGIKYPEKFSGKHILLVDDVVTTGSTLEACASEILKLNDTKVSIATMAFADF